MNNPVAEMYKAWYKQESYVSAEKDKIVGSCEHHINALLGTIRNLTAFIEDSGLELPTIESVDVNVNTQLASTFLQKIDERYENMREEAE